MIIRGMAYPDSGINHFDNGASFDTIKRYLADLGIVYSRATKNDRSLQMPCDWYNWQPTAHHTDADLMDIIDEFLNIDTEKLYSSQRFPRLFYLWGHTYEFDNNNNWELVDEICKKVSGREDIWYATGIEIYDYTAAYNSLITSADEKIIYNPSLYDIWFDADGKTYKIKSGETIVINN